MPENVVEDVTLTEDIIDPEPHPTPEEEEEWERERQAAWDAKIKPFRDLRDTVVDHDDMMAEMLYEMTMIEIGMEE